MKILHLAKYDLSGGAAKAAYRIHRSLNDQGIDSWMLVDKKVGSDPKVIGPSSGWEKLWAKVSPRIDRLPLKFMSTENTTILSPAWVGSPVLRKIPQLNPDIIHLHWVCDGFLKPETLTTFRKPLVWRLADMWPLSGSEHYVAGTTRYRDGYNADNRPAGEKGLDINRWVWNRKVAAWKNVTNLTIVTPSKWLGDVARESVLFRDRRVEVIPTGQDLNTFHPVAHDEARKQFGLPLDRKLILFGAVDALNDKRKGFHLLRSALQSMANKDLKNNYELVVFGSLSTDPSEPFEFKTHILGPIKEGAKLAMLYASCDLFVAPSMEENLANTVIESMACGTPVVAFHVGGMPDMITHRENGYLAKPFEVEDLVHGMEWVLADPLRWSELSKRAREKVVKNFSLEEQGRRYAQLYEQLLS